MLSQITLSNFFSLRDPSIIEMRASYSRAFKSDATKGNVFSEDGTFLLKSLAVFGANASGKSNLLKAIEVCFRYISESHNYSETTPAKFSPFKFNEDTIPSVFEVEITIEGEKYEYGFSILKNKVVEEHLYSYPKKYKALVFKRSVNQKGESEYIFSKKFTRPKDVEANTSPYTLFLTRAALMGRVDAAKILGFATSRVIFGLPAYDDADFEKLLVLNKATVIDALRYADSDIVDYELKAETYGKRLVTYHKSDPSKPFDFNSEESAGTQRLLRLLVAFIDAADNGKILIVDELETSLHPQLVRYALKLFNKSNRAQLIFSTHDLGLMDVALLRPDQIYFASKNYDCGSTEIYSLADFTDYKGYKNLRRDYEQGRFDAIPILPTV